MLRKITKFTIWIHAINLSTNSKDPLAYWRGANENVYTVYPIICYKLLRHGHFQFVWMKGGLIDEPGGILGKNSSPKSMVAKINGARYVVQRVKGSHTFMFTT